MTFFHSLSLSTDLNDLCPSFVLLLVTLNLVTNIKMMVPYFFFFVYDNTFNVLKKCKSIRLWEGCGQSFSSFEDVFLAFIQYYSHFACCAPYNPVALSSDIKG